MMISLEEGPPIASVQVSAMELSESVVPEMDKDHRESRSPKKRLSLSRASKGLKRMLRPSHSSARPVLEYYDVCLRQDDIDNLKPNQWLQDSNIEFFYEWIERERLPKNDPQAVFLLRPSIGYLCASIAQQGGVVDETLLPTGFMDAKYVFIPVTDNIDPAKAGGSHWSLVLVGIDENTVWYYDSLPTTGNDKLTDCRCYAKAMNQVFEKTFELEFSPTPKQSNSSDCGIHVCIETEVLLERILKHSPEAAFNPSLAGQAIDAAAYRSSLQQLILKMIEQRGRRIGKTEDIAVSPERRSSSRTRPSIDQRLQVPCTAETIHE